MCWNLEASLLTGAFCWLIAGYLIKRNVRWDRTSALSLMAVLSMQFADAVLWWDGVEVRWIMLHAKLDHQRCRHTVDPQDADIIKTNGY